ncbi:MAG: hypothetical protein ABI037_05720 [Gemmatimonadales bacterium]
MDRVTRSRLEMGARALEFSLAHRDESSGYTVALTELEGLLRRSEQLTDQQRVGVQKVRAATARKRELRREIRQQHLMHVAMAARRAAREVPELAQKFVLARHPAPYLSFRSLARTLLSEAQERKEILVKHGLVERVLDGMARSLVQFDEALAQGQEGRRMHVAASVELEVVAGELVQIVRIVDGLNRFRFSGDPDLFAAWRSASNVVGPSHPAAKPAAPEAPPSDGAVKPAA